MSSSRVPRRWASSRCCPLSNPDPSPSPNPNPNPSPNPNPNPNPNQVLPALTDEQKALSDASDVEATAEMTAWAAAEAAVASQNAAAIGAVPGAVPAVPVAPVAPAVAPVAPVASVAPVAPVAPAVPVVISEPGAVPVEPAVPVTVQPAAPVAPVQPATPVVKQPVQPTMEGVGGYLTRGGSEQASWPAPQQAQQASFQPVTPYTEQQPVVVGAVQQEQQGQPPMTPDLGWPVGQQEQRPGDGKAKDDKETLQRMLHPQTGKQVDKRIKQEPADAVEAGLQVRDRLQRAQAQQKQKAQHTAGEKQPQAPQAPLTEGCHEMAAITADQLKCVYPSLGHDRYATAASPSPNPNPNPYPYPNPNPNPNLNPNPHPNQSLRVRHCGLDQARQRPRHDLHF